MKIVNQTPVLLEVPEAVARHLLACDAWDEPKSDPKKPPAGDLAAQVKE